MSAHSPNTRPLNARPQCLIVDGSAMVRRVAARIVRDIGFEAVEARTGREALDAAQLRRPDAVLMDWVSGEMEAPELIAALRGSDTSETPIRVVLCTADRRVERIEAALAAGADEYIMKPFDSDIIESKFRLTGLPVSRRAPFAA